MKETLENKALRLAKTAELFNAIVRVDCDDDFVPSPTLVATSKVERVCSCCGKPIAPGDIYYYLNNRGGFVSCERCVPVAVKNRVYFRNHPIAKQALTSIAARSAIRSGDYVMYENKRYQVGAMGFIGNLRAPFCALYDEETHQFYQDKNGAYLAVSVVGLKKIF